MLVKYAVIKRQLVKPDAEMILGQHVYTRFNDERGDDVVRYEDALAAVRHAMNEPEPVRDIGFPEGIIIILVLILFSWIVVPVCGLNRLGRMFRSTWQRIKD
jgi:hypothetical protein